MKLLKDLNVGGKRVFLRADLDVNVADIANQTLEEATRLQNTKPTVEWLLEHGAKQIVIAGHIGRPEKPDPKLSTKQLVEPLGRILGCEIEFLKDFSGPVSSFLPASAPQPFLSLGKSSDLKIDSQKGGVRADGSPSTAATRKILLLENLRFWPGETGNDQVCANKLAILGDVYVNDAFGNCHRAHASMVLLPKLLPHAAGIHLEREVEEMTKLLHTQERPFVAVIGGIKKETKLPVIINLAKLAEHVLVGGALVSEIKTDGSQIASFANVTVGVLTPDGNDLDDATVARFESALLGAKTVVWNGPLGHFEDGHTKGSIAVAEAIFKSGAYSVVGGGETTELLGRLGFLGRFGFVSSGGGAMLLFLAGKDLPGIRALE